MKHTLIFILALAFAACSNEKPAETVETPVPQGVDVNTVDSITKVFMLPDSINTALIIATYVEIDPESHTLLMYTSTNKKEAKRVRYLNAGGVTVDRLDVISDNEFRSTDRKLDFYINDSNVLCKTGPNEVHHYRTDANN